MAFGILLIILIHLLGMSSITVDSQMNQAKPVTAQKRNFHLHPIDIKLANKVRKINQSLGKPWDWGIGYGSMVISDGYIGFVKNIKINANLIYSWWMSLPYI